jgi:hypothetical protein
MDRKKLAHLGEGLVGSVLEGLQSELALQGQSPAPRVWG